MTAGSEHQLAKLFMATELLQHLIQMQRLRKTWKPIHVNLFHSSNFHINANLARWDTLIPQEQYTNHSFFLP